MLAEVTNVSRGIRGFHLADGGTRFVEPGETALLDLADHPAHEAWVAKGEVAIRAVARQDSPSPTVREKVGRRSRAG